MYRLTSDTFASGALAAAAIAGTLPRSLRVPTARGVSAWRERVDAVRRTAESGWLEGIRPAFGAGDAALVRLATVERERGVVVTTGQQPGLYGGPLFTWYKALSALAFADAIQSVTGVPAAPVFWAATDDSDFAEASWTAVSLRGGEQMIKAPDSSVPAGTTLMRTPLGDMSAQMPLLRQAAGPGAASAFLDIAFEAYAPEATHGQAYLSLMRAVLEPLGIAVLDASHGALRNRERPTLIEALRNADALSAALSANAIAIRGLGMEPQVNEVQGLSLVFVEENGVRRRVTLTEARDIAASRDATLSPNVLLRPVVELAVLPAVAYCAGPAEMAYGVQSAAVASELGVLAPMMVPRWTGTVMEDHVDAILERHSVSVAELREPHDVWARLASRTVSPVALNRLNELRRAVAETFGSLKSELAAGKDPLLQSPEVVEGAQSGVMFRLARFERRIIAAAKRREASLAEDLATARGWFFPLGKKQERALNAIPLLARHGAHFLEDVRRAAARHADAVTSGDEDSSLRSSEPHGAALTTGA
jgi:bacillithiol biosynthesis cysteine-adding enzyme BshC